MKKYSMMLFSIIFILSGFRICLAEVDIWNKDTETKMREVDTIMDEIKSLPDTIDDDICAKDWSSYRQHMTQLAQKIIDVNMIIDDVKIVYPIDLWSIYNIISSNPICGVGKQANYVFGAADMNLYSNEERMGINESDIVCPCWSIITGREELTGYYKDGACRCLIW